MTRTDVIIVGGGMVGLTAALALAREGLTVQLLEKRRFAAATAPAADGRTSAIALGSKQLFDRLGVWDAMAPQACPIDDIHISDGNSPRRLRYDHREVGEEPFGWILENQAILTALQKAVLAEKNIAVQEGVSPQSLHQMPGLATVTVEDSPSFAAPLLLAADGKHSGLRLMAGMKVVEKAYAQVAIVCTVRHEKPHGNLAQERFLPAGPFAILPMTDDAEGRHRSSLVWTEAAGHGEAMAALPEAEFMQELAWRFTDCFGALALEGKRFVYPLAAAYAETLAASRLLLIGDAAHSIHPVAGQGVNLGFRDVETLAAALREARSLGQDIGDAAVLARYAKNRQFDVHSMLTVTDGLNGLFSNRHPLLIALRRSGLALVGGLPPVKRLFMRHAMGVLFPLAT